MRRFFLNLITILTLISCTNAPELETGEMKTLALLNQAVQHSNKSKQFIDARNLLNRQQIDEAKTAVLFVELPTGQNGTLTPYPGEALDKHG